MAWTNWGKAALLFFLAIAGLDVSSRGVTDINLKRRTLIQLLFFSLPLSQFVEAISNKQGELDNYIAEGYKNALSEERRRYCFLVDRQCAVAKNSSAYHGKVRGKTPSLQHLTHSSLLLRCAFPIVIITCSPALALSPIKWTGKTLQFVIGKQKESSPSIAILRNLRPQYHGPI